MTICRHKPLIEIRPAFIAFLCAYYYFDPARSFFPFLFSVTLHEASHLLTLTCLRVPVCRFSLSAVGAVLETPPLSYRDEIIAAASGPAVNAVLFLLLIQKDPAFALVNFCLLAYNLLPFYPLDGGRILRAVLCTLFQERTAQIVERLITLLGMLSLTALAVYLTCIWHAGLWPVLVCAILLMKISCQGETTFFPVRVDKRKSAC